MDIDNTLLSQARRILTVISMVKNTPIDIEKVLNGSISLEKPLEYYKQMNEKEIRLFYSIFLSDMYYYDEEKKEYLVDPIPMSREILWALKKDGYRIFYVTARIYNNIVKQFDMTYKMLKDFDYPIEDKDMELILMPNDYIPDSYEGFYSLAKKFKREVSKELKAKYRAFIGIGDSSSDIDAYNEAGIVSVQARFVIPEYKYYNKAKEAVYKWSDFLDIIEKYKNV